MLLIKQMSEAGDLQMAEIIHKAPSWSGEDLTPCQSPVLDWERRGWTHTAREAGLQAVSLEFQPVVLNPGCSF